MRNEQIRYGLILLVVILFGLFVYPTIYKYDKLEQKYPVKINRITGNAQVLVGTTWKSTENEATVSDMVAIKAEIFKAILEDHDKLRQEISADIKNDIIQSVQNEISSLKDDIANARAEIEVYKKFETDPDNYFAVGDTKEKVKEIMGVPNSTYSYEYINSETWYYGLSSITFKNGKVKEWSDNSKVLRVK